MCVCTVYDVDIVWVSLYIILYSVHCVWSFGVCRSVGRSLLLSSSSVSVSILLLTNTSYEIHELRKLRRISHLEFQARGWEEKRSEENPGKMAEGCLSSFALLFLFLFVFRTCILCFPSPSNVQYPMLCLNTYIVNLLNAVTVDEASTQTQLKLTCSPQKQTKNIHTENTAEETENSSACTWTLRIWVLKTIESQLNLNCDWVRTISNA